MKHRILFYLSILLFLFFGLGARLQPIHAATFTWNTFLGGGGTDYGWSIALDSLKNIYITGYSNATWGTPIRMYTASNDAFVAKLDTSGNLLWNTFLGGSGNDSVVFGPSIVLDSANNIYVTGKSGATWGSPIRAYTASIDTFVAKLNSSGTLLWNTFLGGSGLDPGISIIIDLSGNIYIAGYSTATWGSPIRAYTASSSDAFVAKLEPSGTLLWNTFLGGSGFDVGYSIAQDSTGTISVAGYSGATWGSPVRAYTAGLDAFVAKLDSSGNMVWNTFLGGSGSDQGNGITTDYANNIFITGYGDAAWGTPIRAYTASSDAFVAKLSFSGNLLWNTFLGGSLTDEGNAITTNSSGDLFVTGTSYGTWGAPVRAFSPDINNFTAKISNSGELAWNTFLGGSGTQTGYGITVDAKENVFVTGRSTATWGAPVRAYTADNDAFVAQIAYDPPGVDSPVPGKPAPSSPGCSDQPPVGSPNLFRVDMKDTYAILYYSPFSGGNTNYYISYSEEPTSFHHGVFTGQTTATGVLSFTIRDLKPNTTYFFRMRGQNGCMPGVWGNERKGTTTPTLLSPTISITPISHISPSNTLTPTPAVLGTSTKALHPPTQSVSKFQPLKNFPKHFCILWWCW